MSMRDFYAGDDRLHFVYRVFDATDRLLYVGCSVDVDTRMAGHESASPWFPFHSRVERVAYPSRAQAEDAESVAIATEHPRWNIQGRSVDHPDGFAKSLAAAHWLAAEADMGRRWRDLRVQREKREDQLNKVMAQQAALEGQMNAHPAIVALRETGVVSFVSYRRSA